MTEPKNGFLRLFYLISALFSILNIFTLHSLILGLIFGLFWLIYTVNTIYIPFLPATKTLLGRSITLLSLTIILPSLFFYLFNLGNLSVSLILIILSIPSLLNNHPTFVKLNLLDKKFSLYSFLYFCLYIISFAILWRHQSVGTIITPWTEIPKIFLFLYFVLTALLLNIFFTKEKTSIKLSLLFLHFFLSLIIATIVYKIGFGFDPFVHRAAETKLLELGYILPKPFYYIGQYSLIVFLSKLFTLPIAFVDKLLVPFLASIFIPIVAHSSLNNFTKNKNILFIVICCLLFIVCNLFFYTVPQSLANFLFLILIFTSLPVILENKKPNHLSLILSATIFLIHPLSGIPAFIFSLFFYAKGNLKKIYFILASVSLPSLFFVLSSISDSFKISLSVNNFSNLISIFSKTPSYLTFYSIYHFIYLYKFNLIFLFLVFSVLGGVFLYKNKFKKSLINLLEIILIFVINLILLSFLNFNNVIDYEQGEFLKRFLQITVLASSPLFIFGLYFVFSQTETKLHFSKFIIIFLTLFFTVNLYLAYPHNDAFTKARGYSVGESDVKAVEWIDNNANGQKYIVLANQSTSAAGLQQFGFAHYYNNLFLLPNSYLFPAL